MAQARDVRQQNRLVEAAHQDEQEDAFARLEAENIQLSDEFISFDFDNLSNSHVREYDDETLLYNWCILQNDVRDFFRNILSPATFSGVVGSDTFGRQVMGKEQLTFLNQISDVGELSRLISRAKDLGMDKISISYDPPFRLFYRLNKILQIRDDVLRAQQFCQSSSVTKGFWKVAALVPGVSKGDSYTLLEESISKCISTGLFLRKYRDCDMNDCRAKSLEEDPENGKKPGDIIDFRDAAQRLDYLNIDCSEFVEPELLAAEQCLQEKRRAEQAEAQAKSGQRLIEARRAGGKISRRQKLGRRNSKNRK